jgi:hypothetical protein
MGKRMRRVGVPAHKILDHGMQEHPDGTIDRADTRFEVAELNKSDRESYRLYFR